MNQKKLWLLAIGIILMIMLVNDISRDFKQTENSVIKIGVCTYKATDTFIASIVTELEAIIKEEEQLRQMSIKLDIVDAKESQLTQNEQVQKYIALDYDVICVNIVDRTSAASLIDQAASAQIPLIFFNRQPVEEDMYRSDQVYYIGSNAKESAIMQGELILDAYRENPESIDKNQNGIIEYAILEGEAGHQDTIIRTEYAVKTLEDNGMQLKKVVGWCANFDRNQAAALVEQWINSEYEEIELILSNNDDMALGIVDALEKVGQTEIAIVGIDGTPQGREAVDKGTLLGTVVSNQQMYARQIFELCDAITKGKEFVEQLGLENNKYRWIAWGKYI